MDNYAFRKFKNRLFLVLSLICVIIAVIPLLSILVEVIIRGASQINLARASFFFPSTESVLQYRVL
jgi:ABC-type phosphate transport system permease subunit